MLFASTITVHRSAYLLIILIFGITLLLCMAIIHPFKSTVIFIVQSSSLANLVLLSGFLLFAQTQNKSMETLQTTVAGISTGLIFIQFCSITLFNVIKLFHQIWDSKRDMNGKYNQEMNNDDFLIEYHDSREVIESPST